MIKYEDIVKEPEKQIKILANNNDFEVTERVLHAIQQKSFTVTSGAAERTRYDPLNAWKKVLNQKQIKIVKSIVREFNLSEYIQE